MPVHRWPVVGSLAVMAPLFLGCGSDEAGTGDALGTVNGHSVVLQDNEEGADAPCVGVEVRTSEATTVTTACPTLSTENDQYAATIEVDSVTFVVGFGLTENETLVEDGFTDVFVSSEVDGRRFFAAQLADAEDVEAVTISEGATTREIPTE